LGGVDLLGPQMYQVTVWKRNNKDNIDTETEAEIEIEMEEIDI
jgi:hypothetical protein